jgi:hypothetical protein
MFILIAILGHSRQRYEWHPFFCPLVGSIPIGPRSTCDRGTILPCISSSENSNIRKMGACNECRPPLNLPLLCTLELFFILHRLFTIGLLLPVPGKSTTDNHHACTFQFRRSNNIIIRWKASMVIPCAQPGAAATMLKVAIHAVARSPGPADYRSAVFYIYTIPTDLAFGHAVRRLVSSI